MYDQRSYTVSIPGVGTVKVLAASKWHAVDKAYSTHMLQQNDRSKYKARLSK